MKKIYISLITVCLCLLSAYPQYPGDVIELSSTPSGGEIKACHSIVLKPGFSFVASSGQSLVLKVDTTVCSAYIQESVTLPTSQNYVVTVTPLDETDSVGIFKNRIDIARNARALTSIQYFDGLGRPMQTVQKGVTPNKSDLVSILEYDNIGRESKSWLPAPVAGNNGAFVDFNNVKSSAISTYNNDSRPFSEPIYENSPLNRIVKQYGPGQDWMSGSEGYPIKTDYLTNSTTDAVLKCAYYYVSGDNLARDGYYDAGQLFVTKLTDEDNNISYVFKDKLGQLLLVRQMDGNIRHDTYYVYDDFRNRRYVLPPMAADIAITPGDDILNKYAYIYKYDGWRRCTAKKLPGADWQYFAYDRADRLIFSQDGEQRLRGEWTVYIPDALGRTVLTGIIGNTDFTNTDATGMGLRDYMSSNNIIECIKNGEINLLAEYTGTGAYKGYRLKDCYGIMSEISPVEEVVEIGINMILLSVNYYDDYKFLNKNGFPNLIYDSSKENIGYGKKYIGENTGYESKGLLTGTATALLNNSSTMLYTAIYYDDKGRVIQQKSTNHPGGINREYYAYTYTGQPKETLIEHEGDVVVCGGELAGTSNHYVYEYDHAERLKKIILDGVVIEENTYNQLGQLQNKTQGGTLSSDYTYNVRGWLKTIHENLGTNFRQTLYYQDNSGDKYYNGNISRMTYQHHADSLKTFNYYYDNLNRLTTAQIDNGNFNDGEVFSYDKNSNPTDITRTVNGLVSDLLSISYSGNQKTGVIAEHDNSFNFSRTNYPSTGGTFTYNKNGAVTSDSGRDMVTIRYNVLNLPDTIQFGSGNAIYYTYDAGGTKLQAKYVTVKPGLVAPITVPQGQVRPLSQSEIQSILTTNYVGDQIFENGELKMMLFPGGYIRRMMIEHDKGDWGCQAAYHYYLKDYQGNNREVIRDEGSAIWVRVQRTEYTPFGVPYPQTVGNAGEQPYKFGGKEWDRMHGLNYYDFHARMYDPVLTSFLTVDPLCEMYYSISPYAYCGNNPVNAIDPNGKLVIFINGMHFENGGTRDYWDKNGGGFATAVMNHLQDWNDDYIDGSHGGKRSFPWNNSTTDRMDVGFKKGESYARTFRILYKNEDGSFKESIKIITHSMGAAYAKGFIKGLIAGGIPIDLVEFEADFAPYQPKKQEAIEGVKTYQFSHSKDWVAGNDKMNGAEYIDTSSDQNQTHWIEDFRDQIQNLPEGKYRIENGRIVPY